MEMNLWVADRATVFPEILGYPPREPRADLVCLLPWLSLNTDVEKMGEWVEQGV